ncbi:ligand-gated sodium channel [Desmophyllum pertusum]|uniref:Ligand-gated sodium channel n=1 Tax=Desmophyllum pertusum TaxID=174260 RepID=A0A9W9Y6T6_9CNID|nr:ligand-gated sodium channel [Desmophyllum pertusum]
MDFNTGHEYTGKRMINMDANLAKFFINMAAFPDTLTVIFSDHGNKNTQYSYDTEEGRREVFDPVFFMIVPDGVAERLGRQRMAALVENQKRLFTLLDVHKAFMSLNDPEKMNSQNPLTAGIFAVLPANRTCADLNLMPLAICKCEVVDNYNQVKDNSDSHKWLAEFALGTLNDAIQNQHIGGNISVPQRYGYGNCERLVGKSFTNVMERLQGDYILTTMDLHVVPPTGYKEDEVFKVSLKT